LVSLLLWSNIATLQIIAFLNIHWDLWKESLGIFKPGEGNDFLVLDITIKNQLKTTEYSYSQLSMTVKDENGKIYPFSLAIAAVSGALPGGGTLQPGESVRGYVCFEVPVTSQVFVFRYSD